MDDKSLEYLDVCAKRNQVENWESLYVKLALAVELDMQVQATHYLSELLDKKDDGDNFADLFKNLTFDTADQVRRLCRFAG